MEICRIGERYGKLRAHFAWEEATIILVNLLNFPKRHVKEQNELFSHLCISTSTTAIWFEQITLIGITGTIIDYDVISDEGNLYD